MRSTTAKDKPRIVAGAVTAVVTTAMVFVVVLCFLLA